MPSLANLIAYVTQRRVITAVVWICLILVFAQFSRRSDYVNVDELLRGQHDRRPTVPVPVPDLPKPEAPSSDAFRWQDLPVHYPVSALIPLPTGQAKPIPRIQAPSQSQSETAASRSKRLERLAAVKEAFQHAWTGYQENAWMADEVGPLSGARHNPFGGWAASLVDALDTLWIMGMKTEFEEAVAAIKTIDFTTTEEAELNTFETTIRYLGGFLSAYDLSDRKYPLLLAKAMELGEMLLVSFDTPNRMPITRWDWAKAKSGNAQEAHPNALVAEVGSLSLEFIRLSQLTGDARYFDAIQRITDQFDKQQMTTKLPGMWPITVNARDLDFGSDTAYTLGAMSDSLYEYLPKTHLLLGGLTDQYKDMYTRAADTFTKHNFYRPMTEDNADILFSGLVRSEGGGKQQLDYSMQHLVCFAGGMVGSAAKVFEREADLEIARRLVDGCIWAYESLDNGLMAEVSHHIPCPTSSTSVPEPCEWNATKWHEALMANESPADRSSGVPFPERVDIRIQNERLKPGYTAINDRRYILRPEAIESVFIWYRITGNSSYQDKAWEMFEAVEKHTRTEIANAALDDVTASPPSKADRMESFWMAETLKYFYLVFAEVDEVSLDDYVFNTEAHPLLRPKS